MNTKNTLILSFTIIAAILCGYAAGRIEEKNKNHTKECNQSELSPKELEMFPYWYEADRQAGDARFGDLWCTIASGEVIQ